MLFLFSQTSKGDDGNVIIGFVNQVDRQRTEAGAAYNGGNDLLQNLVKSQVCAQKITQAKEFLDLLSVFLRLISGTEFRERGSGWTGCRQIFALPLYLP